MNTFENELVYLQAVAEELETYLISPDLFQQIIIPGRKRLISSDSITPGNIRYSIKLLGSNRLPPQLYSKSIDIIHHIEQISDRWRANWSQKVSREIPVRLRMWKNYLDDLSENNEKFGHLYQQEIRWRVLISLLIEDGFSPSGVETRELHLLDQALLSISCEAGFIWDIEIQDCFPIEEYWYLYRKIC